MSTTSAGRPPGRPGAVGTAPAAPAATTGRLARDGVGVPGMIYAVVAVTAPLTALASNMTLSLALGGGVGTVGVIVLVAVILCVFAAGFVAMSRQVVNAGAYFAYIAHGLGERAGAAAAMVAVVAYNLGAALMAGFVGFFADLVLERYLHVDLPWWAITGVAVALVWGIGYLGLTVSTPVNGWIAISELVLVLALAISVLVQNPGGWDVGVLAPSTVFGGGFGLAFVLCLLSFTGFEAAANLGEEAKDARRSVGRATYAAILVLAVVFVVGTWAVVAAFDDAVAVAQADPGAMVTVAASTYLGAWIVPVLLTMITVSFFGAALAFHNLAARYLFSLGREGHLPPYLARTHARRGTPVPAGTTQVVLSALVLLPFVLAGSDPLVGLGPAIGGVNALAVVALMVACSASIVVASVRGLLVGSTWALRVCPTISAVALLGGAGVIVSDYAAITGTDARAVAAMPFLLVVAVAYGWWAAGRGARS
ncbi:MAG: APC family permease [Nocardioides alkalitolerans]